MVPVAIHASQFPDRVRKDLLESLRRRRVNHKFLYDSVRQTQQWLKLHQACSPSRTDPDCAAIYDRSFRAVAERINARQVHLIGLGCGGGQKDTRLLKRLKARGRQVFYTPCDVSAAMVLTARQTALAAVPERNCFPFVCDLASAGDLPSCFSKHSPPKATRLITFFGMVPNFEPEIILPKLAALVRRNDLLLLSANLAPGENYRGGMGKILPQYDNPLTRDWLTTFLLDVGIDRQDGRLRFRIDTHRGLRRVVAEFEFARSRRLELDGCRFEFHPDQTLRLFFSYRYTPVLVDAFLRRNGLQVLDQWITAAQEEGVFLCRRERINSRRVNPKS
jgi:L-histidine Nalpha-methyltransferase